MIKRMIKQGRQHDQPSRAKRSEARQAEHDSGKDADLLLGAFLGVPDQDHGPTVSRKSREAISDPRDGG
jgi:hypothetical protein